MSSTTLRECSETATPRSADPAEVLRVATGLVQMVVNAAALSPTELANVTLSIDAAGVMHCHAAFARPDSPVFVEGHGALQMVARCAGCGRLVPGAEADAHGGTPAAGEYCPACGCKEGVCNCTAAERAALATVPR